MSRSHSSSNDDDNTENQHSQAAPTPAASPTGLEARVAKLEEQLAKLMPRVEALTGPL